MWDEKDLWEHLLQIADERPLDESLHLRPSEIEYIVTGDSGGYSKSRLEGRINNRVSAIQTRFQRLINDISLLCHGGYLDTAEMWEGFLEIKGYARPLAKRRSTLSYFEANQSDTLFGYELGLVLSMLTGPAYKNLQSVNFLWGLILANCATLTGQTEEEKKNLDTLVEELGIRRRMHFEGAISHWLEDQTSSKHHNHINVDTVNEVIDCAEYEVPDTVRSYIVSATTETVATQDKNEIDVAANLLISASEKEPLKEIHRVHSVLSQEWETISQATVPGMAASEVLKAIWIENNPRSTDVAKRVKENAYRSGYAQQATQVLNKLADRRKSPSPTVESTYDIDAIIKWDGKKWVLTDYGYLLSYFVFEKERDSEWVYFAYRRYTKSEDRVIGFIDIEEEYEILKKGADSILENNIFDK